MLAPAPVAQRHPLLTLPRPRGALPGLPPPSPLQVRTRWREVTSNDKFWREINLKGRTVQVSKVGLQLGCCVVS